MTYREFFTGLTVVSAGLRRGEILGLRWAEAELLEARLFGQKLGQR